MLWQAALLAAAWAALAVIFAVGWLRGGNGAWRWHSAEHDTNAPLYGLIAIAALVSAAYYLAAAVHGGPLPIGVYRAVREVPILGVFVAVALIRRPWGRR